MDKKTKDELRAVARNAEIRVAQAFLRWKYRKDGKKIPEAADLKRRSEEVSDQARDIIKKRGKNILRELKMAYRREKDQEE